jgi:hypothetical protein
LEDMTALPPGLRMEVRNAFFTALDDARVAAVDDLFTGGGAALALRSMGGAAARVSRDATAFATGTPKSWSRPPSCSRSPHRPGCCTRR